MSANTKQKLIRFLEGISAVERKIEMLKQVLAELRVKCIPGKRLTTSYLTFTEPPDVTLIDKVRNQMQKNI